MINEKTQLAAEEKRDVLITRFLHASPESVFEAWTDPGKLRQWYAPNNCTIHISRIEVHEGGSFLYCIKNPNYPDCWCKGVYQEIKKPERIVFTMVTSDENGNDLSSQDDFLHPQWPRMTTVTVTFENVGGSTKLTLHQTADEALAKQTGAYPGWLEMLDRLVRNCIS